MIRKHLLIITLLLASLAGCAASVESADDEVGSIALNLTAPSGTGCVEEVALNTANGREVRRVFALTPGTPQVLVFDRAPAGDIELSAIVTATLQNGACVGDTMYEADIQQLRVMPGERANVNQHFLSRAQLSIDGTFEQGIYAQTGCTTPVNFALGADASRSDNGWGGGSSKQDMTDGLAEYCDTWAHGLAFTGGPSGWAGASCGWRQATLDLGSVQNISSARFYHHGDYHIPGTYSLEGSLDGTSWFPIADTSTVRYDLATGGSCYGATPTEHTFTEVAVRLVRYNVNNCEMMFPTVDSHGWIYEAELWGCSSP